MFKTAYKSYKKLAIDVLSVLFISGTIGIALKFITFQIILNENLLYGNILYDLFFPYFPNLLDSFFLISAALYLAWRILITRRRL
ncbi:MAG: hypothetical protein JSV20_07720 [Candidatus Bathyarchaeota archaeon]|nr:MAG: hypothetical protein JSV20_07720 [Candidatus Bathyarchaeota archaeon]